MENKDAIINQQRLIIRDQEATINKQRNRLAEFQYHRHKFNSAGEEPLRFLAWVFLKDVWPFKFLWRQL